MSFSFGKHKGKCFEDVARDDPSYVQWVRGLDNPGGAMQDFLKFTENLPKANPYEAKGQGKSKGKGWSQHSPQTPKPGARSQCADTSPPSVAKSTGYGVRAVIPCGARLPAHLTSVLELAPNNRLRVRVEQKDPSGMPRKVEIPESVAHVLVQHRSHGPHWELPLSSHGAIVEQLRELGEVEAIPKWVFTLLNSKVHCATLPEPDLVPERLMAYQVAGVEFGVSRGGRCLIGDEMGLGKTLQALSIALQYKAEWPVLVCCPASLRFVWAEQALQWFPDVLDKNSVQVIRKGADCFQPDAAFWIMSYDLIGKHEKFQLRPDGQPHQFVIVDESHHIKDWSAQRTKAMVPVVQKATRAILLSGTPTRNSAHELHPQLCALHPQFRPSMNEFRARYCISQAKTIFSGKVVTKIVGARNSQELNQVLISTVMIRRTKKEVLHELPPKRRQRVPLECGDARLMKTIRAETGDDYYNSVGEDSEKSSSQSLFAKLCDAKLPAVKEYLCEVMSHTEEKVIIFAHHRKMLDEIVGILKVPHIRIDGTTNAAKRQVLVKRFQEDDSCRVAVLSITACGEGLTLTAAGHVIFAELYWVPGAVEQAEARAHRIGQTNHRVLVDFLVAKDSPDELVYASLDRKKRDMSQVLDGVEQSMNASTKERTLRGQWHQPGQDVDMQKRLLPTKRPPPAVLEESSTGVEVSTAKRRKASGGKDAACSTKTIASGTTGAAGACANECPLDRAQSILGITSKQSKPQPGALGCGFEKMSRLQFGGSSSSSAEVAADSSRPGIDGQTSPEVQLLLIKGELIDALECEDIPRILNCLGRLEAFAMTLPLLRVSKIGREVNRPSMLGSTHAQVARRSRALVASWRPLAPAKVVGAKEAVAQHDRVLPESGPSAGQVQQSASCSSATNMIAPSRLAIEGTEEDLPETPSKAFLEKKPHVSLLASPPRIPVDVLPLEQELEAMLDLGP